jgi:transcription initiation factor TFIIIB Brf1 subunit/transcription initiation factor TFIIB
MPTVKAAAKRQQPAPVSAMARVIDVPDGTTKSSSSAKLASTDPHLNGRDPLEGSRHWWGALGADAVARSAPFFNDDEERCRNCHSTDIRTDWQQGDRVCTNCGVVAEGCILDDRPEWKDFNDAEDIVKGLPSKSRSGRVPVDESKYIGGLQPTILSKSAYGENGGGYKLAKIRKQLKSTNNKLDHLMQKAHQKAVQDAMLERKLRLKQKRLNGLHHSHHSHDDGEQSLRPEFEHLILREEEEAHRMQAALYADKWSLDRALVLYGTSSDNSERGGEDKKELLARMDSTLKKSSKELYTAYSMLTVAAQKLHLPERVMNEVVHQLVRYAARKDGFTVKGVSTQLSSKTGTDCKQTLKAATERLVDYNKTKQMSSLGAAILFLTARNLGWTRTVVEICECFQPPLDISNEKAFLKPKHCSKAMAEIKALFPEYGRPPAWKNTQAGASYQSDANDSQSTFNFADHFIRRLKLPPVAEASVRVLLVHCRQEQIKLGHNSGTKISTLCAAIAYFVCSLGSVMQRVAQQASLTNKSEESSTSSPRPYSRISRKRRRLEGRPTPEPSSSTATWTQQTIKDAAHLDTDARTESFLEDKNDTTADEEPFDAFKHSPIVENQSDTLEYEMRRMWDAWAEQMSWSRSLVEVEQSCGISKTVILNLYKSDLYTRREALLNVLKESVISGQTSIVGEGSERARYSLLQDTPQATILLAHIGIAAALMNDK